MQLLTFLVSGLGSMLLGILSAALVAIALGYGWATAIKSAFPGTSCRVLLVIAHPDDESMFFSPTLLMLAGQSCHVHVLCLSQGNAYGQGQLRQQELVNACQLLRVPAKHMRAIDHPGLQDGMKTVWAASHMQQYVHQAVEDWDITHVITFDELGVSGHINHISTCQGVRVYLKWRHEQGLRTLPCYQLVTTSLVRKYLGLVDVPLSVLLRARNTLFVLNPSPWRTMVAMAAHRSQLVWYRVLFILFSRYTWCNTLVPMDI